MTEVKFQVPKVPDSGIELSVRQIFAIPLILLTVILVVIGIGNLKP